MNPTGKPSAHHQLNYFQQSPVRGQLETPEGFAKSGWQYLQCTDTPNELRVLLPPRTAFIYSHLLRVEALELAKDKAASWERIVDIRHLKDRMIRKCQRLAQSTTPKDKPAMRPMFLTLHAPSDFRLKEMERWFKGQGPEYAHVFSENVTGPFCCTRCTPAPVASPPSGTRQHGSQNQRSAPVQRQVQAPNAAQRPHKRNASESASRSTTYVNSSAPSAKHDQKSRPPPAATTKQSARVPTVVREFDYMPTFPRDYADDRRSTNSDAPSQIHILHANVKSPDPIPVPLRTREPFVASPEALSDASDTLTTDSEDESDAPPQYPPNYQEDQARYSAPIGQTLPTIHEKPDSAAAMGNERPAIPRRRSSLKRCNSTSRLSVTSQTKSVAWAMDKDWIDQMAKYMSATNEAETLGRELEQLRTEYNEQIGVMKGLCRKVAQSAERVRIETENLRNDEAAVREQEQRLLERSEELEKRESLFQDKVLGVLEETKRVVQLCDTKRAAHNS